MYSGVRLFPFKDISDFARMLDHVQIDRCRRSLAAVTPVKYELDVQ